MKPFIAGRLRPSRTPSIAILIPRPASCRAFGLQRRHRSPTTLARPPSSGRSRGGYDSARMSARGSKPRSERPNGRADHREQDRHRASANRAAGEPSHDVDSYDDILGLHHSGHRAALADAGVCIGRFLLCLFADACRFDGAVVVISANQILRKSTNDLLEEFIVQVTRKAGRPTHGPAMRFVLSPPECRGASRGPPRDERERAAGTGLSRHGPERAPAGSTRSCSPKDILP
ncbi:hypothetical protein ACVIHF_000910 [Bradyrhizobium sp. USDA 4506]